METFCALNIIDSKGNLINKDNRPLMFIWDGKSNLFEQMGRDPDFIRFLNKELDFFNNIQNYIHSKIVSFTYLNEDYKDEETTIQEMFPLNKWRELNSGYIGFIFRHLYYLSFQQFMESRDNETCYEYYLAMYRRIKDKYKDKLSKETFIQACRNFLQTDKEFKGMNEQNKEFIMDEIQYLLSNEK